jgi:glucose/arabinose dehydrogenase
MPEVELLLVAGRFDAPVQMVDPGDRSGRLFVVEQPGYIRVLAGDSLLPEPFLDLSSLVSYGGERGLLSMVFPPGFETVQHFYVDYTREGDGASVLARYGVDPQDSNRALPASGEEILVVSQPYANHNGGMTAFGPDGYLYLSLGDGGSGGDPEGNGQDRSTLLGSILRLDVESGAEPYGIPGDNPFAGSGEFREEIWAYGLRNPWRFSFDRITGDIYIGDVGQNSWEEIDFEPAGSPGGVNYGWNIMEGAHCYQADSCDMSGLTGPVFEYGHSRGCSVTGGYVYRGSSYPGLEGIYFFADYCQGTIWGMKADGGDAEAQVLLDTGLQIVSFGEDSAGEIYVIDLRGGVYRLAFGGS